MRFRRYPNERLYGLLVVARVTKQLQVLHLTAIAGNVVNLGSRCSADSTLSVITFKYCFTHRFAESSRLLFVSATENQSQLDANCLFHVIPLVTSIKPTPASIPNPGSF